jgi:succinyl-diaminopimelate desuccinylase
VVEQVAEGRPNVHCIVDGGIPGPTLLFEGHTDVVTEGERGQWTVDPFGGEVRDGRLWGRGAADMKGGLVAALLAARAVAAAGPFPGRLMIAALCDEEGMMAGARHFVAGGHLAAVDGIVCCEPEGGEVCACAKGALRLGVELTGTMAHGAMPFMGANPVAAAGRVLTALAELEQELQARFGEHEHLGRVWLTPTVLHAGEPAQMNVIPARATLRLDVRTLPDVVHRELVDTIDTLVRRAAASYGVKVRLEVIDDRPAVDVPVDSHLVRSLCDSHRAITGAAPTMGGVPGATDGTILTSSTGVPSVVYGPGGKWIAHQVDEYVELDDLATHAEVYVEMARRFLGAR